MKPTKIEFTDDEIETIKDLIADWGFDYNLEADSEKVKALGIKLNGSFSYVQGE
jgi:hypothetical protein